MSNDRLLVLSMIFPPDGVSSAQLLGEIVEDLSSAGSVIRVITTQPHYNLDELATAAQPIAWKRFGLVGSSDFHGVPVTHVKMSTKSDSSVGRILQWVWFQLAVMLIVTFEGKRYEGVLTISPPPTVALVAGLLKPVTGARVVNCIWEMYPDILLTMGVVREGSFALRALRWLELKTYRASDEIAVLHDPMKRRVEERCPQTVGRVSVVPTFADTDFLRPQERSTSLRDKLGLGDGIVVGYAGNLGDSEDLTPVLAAAVDFPELTFLISGDGSRSGYYEDLVEANQAKNIVFTGHLPYSIVPELISTCDIALVVLAPGVGNDALPSKAYRSMACGRPLLAITEHTTALAKLIEEHELGFVADPSRPNELLEILAGLRIDELTEIGFLARDKALAEFSREVVVAEYGRLVGISTSSKPVT